MATHGFMRRGDPRARKADAQVEISRPCSRFVPRTVALPGLISNMPVLLLSYGTIASSARLSSYVTTHFVIVNNIF